MFAYTKIMQALVAAGVTPASTDPYFNLVTLLLNTTTTNGAQNNTFLDSSTANAGSGWTITRNGNTTQGTFTPFSQTGWGNYFGGSSDYLSIADTATLELGSGNFTIEGWIYLNSLPAASGYYAIVGKWVNTQYSYICNMVNNAGTMQLSFSYTTNGTTSTTVAANAGITANTWHHVAYVRNGSGFKIFLNGTEVTSSATISGTLFDGTAALNIGRNGDASQYFPGYISNLRICKAAVYTANFTPSTTSLTTTSQSASSCVLLTCQDNRFLDNASSLTISTGGTPRVQAFSPFAPTAAYSTTTVGGSGYFDGNSDYLQTTSTQIIPASTTYSVEAWIYLTGSYADYRDIVVQGTSGNANRFVFFIAITTGQLALQIGSASITTSTTILPNQWYYVAFVNNAGSYNVYVNGTSVASGTNTTIPQNTSLTVGAFSSGAEYFTGYISNVRISSTARTITVPTSPFSSDANTRFLLNYTNAGIYDAAAKNDLETVANAQVSTTQAKFGTTSMYFDGTGDYLTLPASQNTVFGTGDFTIEFWIYYASASGSYIIFDSRGTNVAQAGVAINTASGSIYVHNGTSNIITATAPTANAWHHIALSRSGSSNKLFIDGTQAGSTATSSTNYSTAYVTGIGAPLDPAYTASYYLNGYIDDLRVTKGYARYTTNFTPPTAAFPVQ